MIGDYTIPGSVVLEKRVNVLREIEHDDNHHEHRHGEKEGANELE